MAQDIIYALLLGLETPKTDLTVIEGAFIW